MSTSKTSGRSRRTITIILLILLLGILIGLVIDRKTQPKLLAGPMVQIPEPGALSIVWEMDSLYKSGEVRLEAEDGTATVVSAASSVGQTYAATIKGLPAGKKYRYTVLATGFLWRRVAMAGPYPTSTAPPRSHPFRFVAFGDSGTGGNAQAALAEVIAKAKPDLVIQTGDLVYPSGARQDYLRNFWEPNAAFIRTAPFMPCHGNHDCVMESGQPLLDTFVLPRNSPAFPATEKRSVDLAERFYWFDYGDALFVAIDSNITGSGEQSGLLTADELKTLVAPWLRSVLSGSNARWKLVYHHHPFYTGSKHPASGSAYLKAAFVDIYEECGVDMVFVGHNHLYERTAPIRKDQMVSDGAGVVYITTGAGGGDRYPEDSPPPAYMRAYNDALFSFTQVDLSPNRLELKQIGEDGKVIDQYVVTKPTLPPQTGQPNTP